MNKTDDQIHQHKHKFKKPSFQFLKSKPLTKSSTTSAIASSVEHNVAVEANDTGSMADRGIPQRLSLQPATGQANTFSRRTTTTKNNSRRLSDYMRPPRVGLFAFVMFRLQYSMIASNSATVVLVFREEKTAQSSLLPSHTI